MRVRIDMNDTLTLTTSGISGPDIQQIGPSPAWEDDSDASYVDLVGKFFGPTEPTFFSKARADFLAQSFAGGGIDPGDPNLRLRIDIRLRGVQTGLPFPLVQLVDASTRVIPPISTPTGLLPTAPTWYTLDMLEYSTAWTSPEDYHIEIVPTTPDPVPGSGSPLTKATRNWYIYEVHPYWWVPSYGAPPCRMFPRSDGLGVGAGRNYPPAKSQQRSSRGVGYY